VARQLGQGIILENFEQWVNVKIIPKIFHTCVTRQAMYQRLIKKNKFFFTYNFTDTTNSSRNAFYKRIWSVAILFAGVILIYHACVPRQAMVKTVVITTIQLSLVG
jgi:hypothetical protein